MRNPRGADKCPAEYRCYATYGVRQAPASSLAHLLYANVEGDVDGGRKARFSIRVLVPHDTSPVWITCHEINVSIVIDIRRDHTLCRGEGADVYPSREGSCSVGVLVPDDTPVEVARRYNVNIFVSVEVDGDDVSMGIETRCKTKANEQCYVGRLRTFNAFPQAAPGKHVRSSETAIVYHVERPCPVLEVDRCFTAFRLSELPPSAHYA